MSEKKYAQYIITRPKPNYIPNFFGPQAKNVKTIDMAYLDDEVIKGGFYVEAVWFTHGSDEIAVYPHTHDYDEVLTFWGSDTENPHRLGGEIEEWIGDEKYVLTESCLIFIPRGLKHGPLVIRRVDRPIFHIAAGNTALYGGVKYA